jgi:hypothetical protein
MEDQSAAAAGSPSADACAERQGALGWALRVALTAHAAAVDSGTRRRARDRLANLLARFSEGEGTADVRAARRVLAAAI